jgi:hypothetical protein
MSCSTRNDLANTSFRERKGRLVLRPIGGPLGEFGEDRRRLQPLAVEFDDALVASDQRSWPCDMAAAV